MLKADRLLEIARLVKQYFPAIQTVGCFARVTDISLKTDGELDRLRAAGYDGLTVGVETGDGPSLAFMDKGYTPEDILAQCQRLDRAGIGYNFSTSPASPGRGRGSGAQKPARRCSTGSTPAHRLLHAHHLPRFGAVPGNPGGNWAEAGEIEKFQELKALVSYLDIPVTFAALGASNAYQFQGRLPEDREALLSALDRIIRRESEDRLRSYRTALPHL